MVGAGLNHQPSASDLAGRGTLHTKSELMIVRELVLVTWLYKTVGGLMEGCRLSVEVFQNLKTEGFFLRGKLSRYVGVS